MTKHFLNLVSSAYFVYVQMHKKQCNHFNQSILSLHTNASFHDISFSELELLIREKHQKNNYHHVITLNSPKNAELTILGETHVKTNSEYLLCKKYIDQSKHIWCEGIDATLLYLMIQCLYKPFDLISVYKYKLHYNNMNEIQNSNNNSIHIKKLENDHLRLVDLLYETCVAVIIGRICIYNVPFNMIMIKTYCLMSISVTTFDHYNQKLFELIPKYENKLKLNNKSHIFSKICRRDKTMTDNILLYMKQDYDNPLCIVGASHTLGICYFLTQNGYKIKHIEFFGDNK